MKYTGAEILIKLLERQGIEVIAGIPGGSSLPIYDALGKSKIEHVLTRHEQGAGFTAQGMARATGKAAVCFATSGPGAVNLLTAIADAKLDSVPVIAITGQVPTSLIGTDAFQEIDTFGLMMPITKHNYLVESAQQLFKIIPEAFEIAESGRPGPVSIDVPKDVQKQVVEFDKWPKPGKKKEPDEIKIEEIKQLAKIINKSKRPLVFAGGGLNNSGSSEVFNKFVKTNSIPVVSSFMGIGSFPGDEPLYMGMLGMHGERYTNLILDETDLLLAFGVRFDDRATGKVSEFCPNARIVHVDIDKSEINKIKKSDFYIEGDIENVLKKVLPHIEKKSRNDWIVHIKDIMKKNPPIKINKKDLLNPANILRAINKINEPENVIVTDVGQHQMWVAQYYCFKKSRTLLSSGGLGTMGFGLPTAIGAALADKNKRVVCISGDGSIQMNIQEFATLADQNLNVIVVIMNNNCLGMVRQHQELFFGKKYFATKFITNPDLTAIAKGFGIKGYRVRKSSELMPALKKAFEKQGPCIIEVKIKKEENVLPMVTPGASNSIMINE